MFVGSPNRKLKPKEKEALAKVPTPEGESKMAHISQYPDLVDVLPDLAAESLKLAAEIKPKEVRRKEISVELTALVQYGAGQSVRGEDWAIVYYPETSTWETDDAKLLAAGVDMETIQACKVERKKSAYVQVQRRSNAGT